jgi:hypothetical protein
MVFQGAISSPAASTTTFEQDGFSDPDLGSMIESFQSPGADRDVFAGAAARRRKVATPQRQIFGNITNRGGGSKNEFTPLLKSVHRSHIRQKIDGDMPMPDFLKAGVKLGSSPALPMGSPSDNQGDSTYKDDDTVTNAPQALPDSSIGSIAPKGRSTSGPLGGNGLLTLREQEKVIDEIKKENFNLKLKIFFLNERLDTLGPEYNDAAAKEVRILFFFFFSDRISAVTDLGWGRI